jgi:hypothetical protein
VRVKYAMLVRAIPHHESMEDRAAGHHEEAPAMADTLHDNDRTYRLEAGRSLTPLYYHGARTHLALDKDAPEPRPVERVDQGRIVETPMVGGLHHRYTRQAA